MFRRNTNHFVLSSVPEHTSQFMEYCRHFVGFCLVTKPNGEVINNCCTSECWWFENFHISLNRLLNIIYYTVFMSITFIHVAFLVIHNKCSRLGLYMENKLLLSVAWFVRTSYVPPTQIEFGWVFRILTLGIWSQNMSEIYMNWRGGNKYITFLLAKSFWKIVLDYKSNIAFLHFF